MAERVVNIEPSPLRVMGDARGGLPGVRGHMPVKLTLRWREQAVVQNVQLCTPEFSLHPSRMRWSTRKQVGWRDWASRPDG